MVVLFHYSSSGLTKLTNEPARNLFSKGYLGVEIFFVISGFIIPFALSKSNYSVKQIFNYMGKRIMRICPPAYIIMTLTIIQFYFIDYFHLSRNIWFETITFARVAHNFLFTADLVHYEWLTGIMWTLAVEFQFYIFVGLFFTFMYKSFSSFSLFALGIYASFYLIPNDYNCLFLYGSLFVMGGATSLFFEGKIIKSQYTGLLLTAAIVCYLQLGIWPAALGILTSLLGGGPKWGDTDILSYLPQAETLCFRCTSCVLRTRIHLQNFKTSPCFGPPPSFDIIRLNKKLYWHFFRQDFLFIVSLAHINRVNYWKSNSENHTSSKPITKGFLHRLNFWNICSFCIYILQYCWTLFSSIL